MASTRAVDGPSSLDLRRFAWLIALNQPLHCTKTTLDRKNVIFGCRMAFNSDTHTRRLIGTRTTDHWTDGT